MHEIIQFYLFAQQLFKFSLSISRLSQKTNIALIHRIYNMIKVYINMYYANIFMRRVNRDIRAVNSIL